ncbi:BON domain-containing protein [Candidatus Cardinium hertigii]|jgi:osmotically-inducible protein OsmY|uniref:BON domain-containing protein n=1 Tax=Candidatus Cardinium hertigii TaxID=247481 RepID=A0A3N2QCJ0_9BACT|nr:BON domain-containing protein [Candidatus Cardinium hertigii]ROT47517.1 BON domain-containing protein [Candidatus Cardinium hertigii]
MVTDGELYTVVMEKLAFEPRLNASNITVSIKGNHDIVLLGGTVKTFIEKSIAENAVKNIAEVRGVVDEIKVNPTVLGKRSDAEIAEAVTSALKLNVMIPDKCIKIVVEKGHVILSGELEWQYQKNTAMSIVSKLWGVKAVVNNMVVKPSMGIDTDKVKKQIIREFERHARIDANSIQVEVVGSKIILKGKVRNFDEMKEAEEAAWSLPGVTEVANTLTIA